MTMNEESKCHGFLIHGFRFFVGDLDYMHGRRTPKAERLTESWKTGFASFACFCLQAEVRERFEKLTPLSRASKFTGSCSLSSVVSGHEVITRGSSCLRSAGINCCLDPACALPFIEQLQ